MSRTFLLVFLAGGSACFGKITGEPVDLLDPAEPDPAATVPPGAMGGSGSPASTTPVPNPLPSPTPDPAAPLPPSRPRAPLRRLSRVQYNNTIRDLLGDDSHPADRFLEDEAPGAFAGTEALAQPSPALIEQYGNAAETLAAAAVKNLAALVPCQPQPSEEACARAFIDDFGTRALRRPLAADEGAGYLALFRRVRAEGDFALGVQAIVDALLASPSFLYRVELPPADAAPGTVVALGPYQIAARLSYFLWNTMPDRELFAAARAGKLGTPAELAAQARRMLADARATEATADFFGHWLQLGALDTAVRNRQLFPAFTDQLRRAMREETLRFAADVTFARDGKLATLLSSPRSLVDSTLGQLYGVTGGSAFVPTELDPTERAGLLTQASLMTLTANGDYTSPTRRGKFVLDRLLCQPPPPPPPQVDFTLPKAKPGETARQRFAAHVANPSCATCHAVTDPIGFGFENYDAIGRFQRTDNGTPVDAAGQVNGSDDVDGPFVGAVALARRLAASAQVRGCFTRQWFAFAQGRPDQPGDQASLAAAAGAFAASDADLRELMVALTQTDAFRSALVEAP